MIRDILDVTSSQEVTNPPDDLVTTLTVSVLLEEINVHLDTVAYFRERYQWAYHQLDVLRADIAFFKTLNETFKSNPTVEHEWEQFKLIAKLGVEPEDIRDINQKIPPSVKRMGLGTLL